ncbi:CPBP family intramembrane glutamic endopeptidase [Vagococcus sp.]|uniref:CPBP family intramembrane glutamic endopeptidase n=1 Tax=Vagococcus sp. TaxID=1933889 RepID=UPI003F9DA70B
MYNLFSKIWFFIKNIILLILLFLLTQVPMTLAVLLGSLTKGRPLWVQIILGASWLVLFLLIAWFCIRLFKKKSPTKMKKIKIIDFLVIFLFYILGLTITAVGSMLISLIYGDSSTANQAAIEQLFGPSQPLFTVLAMTICIAIGAPIFEEIIFRGLPTVIFEGKVPKWVLAIVTSLIFSSGHTSVNIISFLMYFILGLIMYLVYQLRNSLGDSMLFHFINNSIPAIAMLFMYFNS